MSSTESSPPACPVDHNAREAWVRAAKADQQSPSQSSLQSRSAPNAAVSGTCDSSQIDQSQPSTSSKASPASRPKFTNTRQTLSQDRQVSSIPRALTELPSEDKESQSPNAQSSNPTTSSSGNWVYPSESQFHSALVRKHGSTGAPDADTIPSIIPIHNAVNERTWKEIMDWERGQDPSTGTASAQGAEKVSAFGGAGPSLVSFRGDSSKLTPRARVLGWLGYQRPFDRHDWVIRRKDGEELEYVIDYYAGKPAATGAARTPLSFYLDVRPKLNSWEGWRMRFWRFVGWPS